LKVKGNGTRDIYTYLRGTENWRTLHRK